MAAVNDCQEMACAPEVDCEFNPNFTNTMEPEFREDSCDLYAGEAICKMAENPICVILKNSENKVLYSEKQEMAVFEEMPDGDIEGNATGTQFMLQHYNCTGQINLVAISGKDENKNYLFSCKSDKELQFKDGDFPDKIEDKDQDILFLKKSVPGIDRVEFESFLYREHYLVCEEKENHDKLVIKKSYAVGKQYSAVRKKKRKLRIVKNDYFSLVFDNQLFNEASSIF